MSCVYFMRALITRIVSLLLFFWYAEGERPCYRRRREGKVEISAVRCLVRQCAAADSEAWALDHSCCHG